MQVSLDFVSNPSGPTSGPVSCQMVLVRIVIDPYSLGWTSLNEKYAHS